MLILLVVAALVLVACAGPQQFVLLSSRTSVNSSNSGGWVNDSVNTTTSLVVVGNHTLWLRGYVEEPDVVGGIYFHNQTTIKSNPYTNYDTNRTRGMVFWVNTTPPRTNYAYETFVFRDDTRIYLCMRADTSMQFGGCSTPDGMVSFAGTTSSSLGFNAIMTFNSTGSALMQFTNVTVGSYISPKHQSGRWALHHWGIGSEPQALTGANYTSVISFIGRPSIPITGGANAYINRTVVYYVRSAGDSGVTTVRQGHRYGIYIENMGSGTGSTNKKVMNMTAIFVDAQTRANETGYNREIWLNGSGAVSFGDDDESEAVYSSKSNQLDITANTSVNVSSTLSVTKNLVVFGNVSMKRPYGMFSDTTNQTIGATGTAQVINFSTTEDSHQITLQNNSNFTFSQSGDYLIEVSAIFDMSIANRHVELWVRKNNTDVPRSNTIMHIPSATAETVLAVPFIIDVTPNDYISFYWASDDSGARLLTTSASSYSPASPSIIVTMSKISETTP